MSTKTKRLEFRVTPEFKELYEEICNSLKCSKTRYFIERSLSPEFIYIEPGYEKNNEAWHLLNSMSNNMNQIARAMNQLVTFMKQENNIDMLLHEDYKQMAENFEYMRDEVKKLVLMQKDQFSNLFQIANKRELLPCVTEYLEKNDPEYMEELSRRVND